MPGCLWIKVKIVKDVKRSDCLLRFACADVFCTEQLHTNTEFQKGNVLFFTRSGQDPVHGSNLWSLDSASLVSIGYASFSTSLTGSKVIDNR